MLKTAEHPKRRGPERSGPWVHRAYPQPFGFSVSLFNERFACSTRSVRTLPSVGASSSFWLTQQFVITPGYAFQTAVLLHV